MADAAQHDGRRARGRLVKRYRFRLEQVQRVRRVQEDQAASALGIAQRAEASAIAAESDRRASIGARARFVGSASGSTLLADRALWEAELADLRSDRKSTRLNSSH